MKNVNIRANNLELTSEIEGYIRKKVEAFTKYVEGDSVAKLFVEVQKTTDHHKNGNIFRAEFNMETSNGSMRAEADAFDLYAAIDEAKDELLTELRKNKDKRITIFRKGHQQIKDFLRRFNN